MRCLVVDAADGRNFASAVIASPRWAERLYCDPAHNRYRQHPLDYVESLEASVRHALAACGRDVADAVRGISFDTTASTPALTDSKGTPLALLRSSPRSQMRCSCFGRTIRPSPKRMK